MDIVEFRQTKLLFFQSILLFFLIFEIAQNGGFKAYFKKTSSFVTAFLIAITNILFVQLVFGNKLLEKIEQNTLPGLSLIEILASSSAIIVLLDLWTYFWHRINHKFPLLWKLHEVHHLDESLHSLSAIRFHFLEILLSYGIRLLFFIYLPITLSQYLIYEFLYALLNIFAHANIKIPFPIEKQLEKIFVTPRFHRLHHHPDRKIHDSNYSTIFSFWDKFFKTHTSIQKEDSFLFGVQGRSRKNFLELLILPFKR